MKNTLFFLGLFLTSVQVFCAADKESLHSEEHSSAEVGFMAAMYAHVYGGLPTDNFVKPQPKVFFSARTGEIEKMEIQDLPDGHKIPLKGTVVALIGRTIYKGEEMMNVWVGTFSYAYFCQDEKGNWRFRSGHYCEAAELEDGSLDIQFQTKYK